MAHPPCWTYMYKLETHELHQIYHNGYPHVARVFLGLWSNHNRYIYIYIKTPLHISSQWLNSKLLGFSRALCTWMGCTFTRSLSLSLSMYRCIHVHVQYWLGSWTCTVLARLIKFILFTTHQMYLTKNKLSIRKFTNFLIEIEHYPHQFPLVVLVQEPPKNGCHAPRTSIVVMHHNLIINQK